MLPQSKKILESPIEAEVVAWAESQGMLPIKLNLMGNTGWPDRVFMFVHPFVAFIEFKRPGKPLKGERNQPARIEELRKRGYPVGVFNDAQEAIAFLAAQADAGHRRGIYDQASLCRLAMEAREREDNRSLHGVTHPSRKRIR